MLIQLIKIHHTKGAYIILTKTQILQFKIS